MFFISALSAAARQRHALPLALKLAAAFAPLLSAAAAPAAMAQAAQAAQAQTAQASAQGTADKTAAKAQNGSQSPRQQDMAALRAQARLTESGPPLLSGMEWRIYGTKPGLNNKLPLIRQSAAGTAEFSLKPGNYILFAAFGRAEQSRSVTLAAGKSATEIFTLNAGGLKLNATLPDGKINQSQLHFTIYPGGQANEQKPLIEGVKSGEISRLPAGSYHIVCSYGSANAITRSDIRIEAGKLTEATMQSRAAQIILKLVRQKGGEALADTNWAVMNDSGDIVGEIANANAYIILAEGNYVAVAKNKDQIYQKEFSVSSGKDEEIEVPATAQNSVDEDGID